MGIERNDKSGKQGYNDINGYAVVTSSMIFGNGIILILPAHQKIVSLRRNRWCFLGIEGTVPHCQMQLFLGDH